MASDRPDQPAVPPDSRPLIFISDASAEADQLALALKRAGYGVVDVALSMLASRVAVQRPSLILCDVDADGSLDAIRALREVPNGTQIDVLLVGVENGNLQRLSDQVRAEASATFTRPVEIAALTKKVERLVGPGGQTAPTPSQPASHRPPILVPSSSPPRRNTDAPRLPSDIPSSLDEPEPEDFVELERAEPVSAPPDVGSTSSRPPASHLELSPEIVTLLLEAERRVTAEQRDLPWDLASDDETTSERQLEPETDAGRLPNDVLEALDEPLEEELVSLMPPFEPSMGEASFGTQAGTGAGIDTSSGTATGSRDATGAGTNVGTEPGLTSAGRKGTDAGEPGTSAGFDARSDDERRHRQEAATPRPPARDGQASTVPPRTAPSTNPPSRPDTAMPPRAPSVGPPPTVQSDAPPSAFQSFVPNPEGAGEPAIRRLESEPAGPPTTADPSTAPPPFRGRADEPAEPAGPASEPSAAPVGPPEEGAPPEIPSTLRVGSATRAMAAAITARWSGGIAFEVDQGIRRLVFRDGDFVTAASGVHGESLVSFLVNRGDLPAEVAREAHKLPISGRHAGAALVARGHLTQDQLWEVLRAHAEWIIARVAEISSGSAALERELPGRLKDEPAVFGGATGAEVLVEILRRTLEPEEAASRLGGWDTAFALGPGARLLGECALAPEETELLGGAAPTRLRDLVQRAGDPSFAATLYALVELGVLSRAIPKREEEPLDASVEQGIVEMDAEALRERILARRALVQEGDYFSLLGVPRAATAYDIRRAYVTLRRELDPSRALTPRTADLEDDLVEILEVIDEAYDILKDQVRRERYRRAIGATP